ncbi:hypothetical protein [Anaeromicropila herbilytica]|uniref:Uncharacterized protein n=1 Tax=Anaeromicropila herbilytica TaxID=2785025 RepID=A0A7R7IEN0_9FIRM|nr:hypothetical protein [Anaeromicropila herbilytica]BCN32812.1 hypothetical protein bsdtb5_41070 [Anaeromicropila herbilytica]
MDHTDKLNSDLNMPQSSYIKERMHYNICNTDGSVVCPDWVNEYSRPIPIRAMEYKDSYHSKNSYSSMDSYSSMNKPIDSYCSMNPSNNLNNSLKMQQNMTGRNTNSSMAQIPTYSDQNYPFYLPMFPMYGYDNSKELDQDLDYMKNMYPNTCRKLQSEIDEECDKLEYEGSCMFDEYPDKCHLESIVDRIYNRFADASIEDALSSMNVSNNSGVQTQQYCSNCNNNDWLRNIIQIMLFNEFFNRRRRYRRRRRWY